jgi:transposase
MWCVAKLDDEYIDRMEILLDLYQRPASETHPVVCLDEKPIVLREDFRQPTCCKPGRPPRRDYEYIKHGTANAFVVVAPRLGQHMIEITPNRKAPMFAEMLLKVSQMFSDAKRIHLVVDNLNTHVRKSVVGRYGEKAGDQLWKRFKVHYTPKHASWLNQAEIGISMFSSACLKKRRISSIPHLTKEAAAYEKRANGEKRTIDWRFTKQKARKKFGYYTQTL